MSETELKPHESYVFAQIASSSGYCEAATRGGTGMKCTDCRKEYRLPSQARRDICPDCWELRKQTIAAVKSGTITIQSFREIQIGMQRGEGQKAMLVATKSDLYEI